MTDNPQPERSKRKGDCAMERNMNLPCGHDVSELINLRCVICSKEMIEKQLPIDARNLRFYAISFREHKWETEQLSWTVFYQTLNEIADRIDECNLLLG